MQNKTMKLKEGISDSQIADHLKTDYVINRADYLYVMSMLCSGLPILFSLIIRKGNIKVLGNDCYLPLDWLEECENDE